MDTNAYAAFKRGDENTLAIVQHAQMIALSPVVLGELLSGFAVGKHVEKNRIELSKFLNSPRVFMLPIDETSAEYYAFIYRQLKIKGRPIPTNDLWIAATALQHGLAVFSYDKHFCEIEGLLVVKRLEDIYP